MKSLLSLVEKKLLAHLPTNTTVPRSPMHLQCIGLNNISEMIIFTEYVTTNTIVNKAMHIQF